MLKWSGWNEGVHRNASTTPRHDGFSGKIYECDLLTSLRIHTPESIHFVAELEDAEETPKNTMKTACMPQIHIP